MQGLHACPCLCDKDSFIPYTRETAWPAYLEDCTPLGVKHGWLAHALQFEVQKLPGFVFSEVSDDRCLKEFCTNLCMPSHIKHTCVVSSVTGSSMRKSQ